VRWDSFGEEEMEEVEMAEDFEFQK